MKRVEVDDEICIGCGLCVEICPEIFNLNSEGKAESINAVEDSEELSTEEAINSCPTEAIAWA